MRNLIRFISRHSFLFLFLLLEAFAFFLIVQSNFYQRTKFLDASNVVVGNIYGAFNNVTDYFELKNVNEELALENAKLRSRSIQSMIKVFGKNIQINDTIYRQRYVYTSAEVINNSVNKRSNYITLNRGKFHGVEQGMGVISPDGAVGIVKNASEHFSVVLSLLHKDSKTSAIIKKNGYFGSLTWPGDKYRYGKLQDVPNHVDIEKGDSVITSGYSAVFPKGIFLGTISDFTLPQGSNFYNIDIEYGTDFKRLSHVYIVKNILKQEQKQIEELAEEE